MFFRRFQKVDTYQDVDRSVDRQKKSFPILAEHVQPCLEVTECSTHSRPMGTSAEHGGGRVTVCCRIRPLGTSTEGIPIDTNHQCLLIQSAEPPSVLAEQTGSSSSSTARRGAKRVRGGARNDRWGFTFDDVLEAGCSQEAVYRKCAKGILESALNGVNGTIMACE